MQMEIEEFKKLIKKNETCHAEFINEALTGERYYKNESDILNEKKKEDGEGNVLRNADNRIPRNFHGLIVNQKASYAFTVPPLFDLGSQEKNNYITKALGDEYTKNCMKLCINAANTSIGWLHYWKGEKGEFEWAVVDSKQIVPVWDKSLKQNLTGIMRRYEEIDEASGEGYIVYEYWTDTECQAYRHKVNDTVDMGLCPYKIFGDAEAGEKTADYRHDMEEVPFIPFNNNNIHTNDLKNIKRLIDVYDKVYSGFINDLDDVQEIIFILSGYEGEKLDGFMQELKKYKTIKLNADEGANVSTLNIEIPVEARKTVLDLTRKAIFEQGQGFDPNPESFGNQSGEALKFMYSLLEMKTGLMETEFRTGFARLIRAICRFYDISCDTIEQTWTRTRIKNDTELAEICKNSVGIISRRTIIANHPFVSDIQKEISQIEEEEREEQEKEDIYRKTFAEEQNMGKDGMEGEE